MENLRKRINVRLVNNAKVFLKYNSKPTYITRNSFNKDYAAIHESKPLLILKKQFMLDLPFKIWVNRRCMAFITNFIEKKNLDAELLFTDTDSLTDEIK